MIEAGVPSKTLPSARRSSCANFYMKIPHLKIYIARGIRRPQRDTMKEENRVVDDDLEEKLKEKLRRYREEPCPEGKPCAGPCHVWQGATNTKGYGAVWWNGKPWLAHRAAHVLYIGPIPPGMDVMHLCDVKLCINPAHIVAGTRGSSGFHGVWRAGNKWQANVWIGHGRTVHIGSFDTAL